MTGKFSIFGIDGTLAYTGVGATFNSVVGIGLKDKFDIAELKDKGNNVISESPTNRRAEVSFDIIIFDPATPGTIATAKSKVVLPYPLAVVTIADMGITYLDGTWNYVGDGEINFTVEGYVKMTLPCRRRGNDLATATAMAVL